MATSGTVIKQRLYKTLKTYGSAVGLTIVPENWSKKDYKKLTLDVVADSSSLQEQQFDSHVLDIEEIIERMAPPTKEWMQYQFLNVFQYDSTNVQIPKLTLPYLVPKYDLVNDNYKIIKYCAVVKSGLGKTAIKVAGSNLAQITSPALDAVQTFANIIGVPGITYEAISLPADRLFMQLNVYYNGLYSAVIQNNVINAIKDFLYNFSTNNFNGVVLTTQLEQAIMKVDGVIDVTFDNLQARAASTTVGSGTNLILNKLELQRYWQTVAGYITPEDTSGGNWRLTDYRTGSSGPLNLNLIAQ